MTDPFADIRPYRDDEVAAVLARLLNNPEFLGAMASLRLGRLASIAPSLVRPLVRFMLAREVRDVADVRVDTEDLHVDDDGRIGATIARTGQIAAHRVSAGERDREDLTSRLVEAEHQLGRLMNLYVATFQLHATLDPTEVQATIAKKWSGFLQEYYSNADNFSVDFGRHPWTLTQRAVILAAAISIEYSPLTL